MANRTVPFKTFRNGQVIETRQVNYTTTVDQDNEETLRTAAANALATNRTFIELSTPTAAQVAAQVKALSRQMNAIIRLVTSQLDATD